jgi:hypothetical protein
MAPILQKGDPPGARCTDSCYNAHATPSPWGTPGGYPHISGRREQFENHVLRAGSSQSLETLFCWHGFQYVRVSSNGTTGFAGRLHDIVGLAIHTNMTATGTLIFDDSPAGRVLAGVNEMTLQSQRTNVAAYMPTDCPTRCDVTHFAATTRCCCCCYCSLSLCVCERERGRVHLLGFRSHKESEDVRTPDSDELTNEWCAQRETWMDGGRTGWIRASNVQL